MHNALIFSRGIWNIPHLAAFLPECHLQKAGFLMPARPDVVMGWGLRPSARKARAYATQRELPYIALEDGFLRSLGLGVAGWLGISMGAQTEHHSHPLSLNTRTEAFTSSTWPIKAWAEWASSCTMLAFCRVMASI